MEPKMVIELDTGKSVTVYGVAHELAYTNPNRIKPFKAVNGEEIVISMRHVVAVYQVGEKDA